MKCLAAPEKQLNRIFQLAVTNDWIAVEKPDRMAVPDLTICAFEVIIDFSHQEQANFS